MELPVDSAHVRPHRVQADVEPLSVDASVRITLIDRDVPSYFQSLEHLLRYCARPPFALERLSIRRGEDGRIVAASRRLPTFPIARAVTADLSL